MYLVKMAARFLSKQAEERFVAVLPQVIKKATTYQGFISVDFWRNYNDPSLLLEDSYWQDKEAASAWRVDPFHQHLQRLAYSSLIMENTTTFWSQAGDVKVYVKCPVCDNTDTSSTSADKAPIFQGKASCCSKCGFVFPTYPAVSDAH